MGGCDSAGESAVAGARGGMIRFAVGLAGATVELRCRFEGNRGFLGVCITGEAPVVCKGHRADRFGPEGMQAEFDRLDEAGVAGHRGANEW